MMAGGRRGRAKGDHEARRIEIAEAACRVIVRLGIERAGIADIARELGYSTGVLMHYYRSKEQLLFFAKNLLFDRVYERVQQARAKGAAADRLLRMALEILPLNGDSLDRWRVLTAFNGLAIGRPELTVLQARRNSRFARLFADAIVDLQREGVVAKAVDAHNEASAIMAMVDGIAGQLVMARRSWRRQQVIAALKRYIRTLE